MGVMPPYDPLRDRSVQWAKVKVLDCQPPAPTWARPALVRLAVLEALPSPGALPLPAELLVGFGPPREAGQAYFYEARSRWEQATSGTPSLPSPPPPEESAPVEPTYGPPPGEPVSPPRSPLDATPVEVPSLGSVIWVWLTQADGEWTIPSSRLLGMRGPDQTLVRSRWIDDAATVRDEILAAIASR